MPLAPAAPERGPRHVANALDTLATALLPSLQEAARVSVAPVSPATSLHARYLWAHDVLSAPLGELMADMDDADPALSRLSSLMAVVRGRDPGDAQARTALVLSVLPLRDLARQFTGPGADLQAAELLLVVMLQGLFNMTHEQGRQLLPLVHAHGRELSLAQWVLAVQQPGRQHGALEMDTLAAVETRLNAMHPLAQMDEAEAEELLLRTVLPGWGPASRAALAQQWRDDRDGWSLADAAVRVRELTDNGRRRIEDALRTLHRERVTQRPPPAPAGSVAHALMGLLQSFFGLSAATFADDLMARTGMSPAAPAVPVIQWPSALGTVATATTSPGVVRQHLEAMHNRLRDKYEGNAFYGELMKRDPRATGTPASARPVASPGRLVDASRSIDTVAVDPALSPEGSFAVPGHLESPGRLTDALGEAVLPPPNPALIGIHVAEGGVLRPTTTGTRAPSLATSSPSPSSASPGLSDDEIALIEASLPAWITQAALPERETLQNLLDSQNALDDVLWAYLGTLESLHAFTQSRLELALRQVLPSHTLAPDDVNVTLTQRTWPPADVPGEFMELPQWPQPHGGVTPIINETTLSLTQFALRNAGPTWTYGPDFSIVGHGKDAGGGDVRLDEDTVVALVRGLDVADAYPRHVNKALLPSASKVIRDAWADSTQAGLRVALQTARMSGTVFPKDFFNNDDPVEGQDFVSRMVATVVNHPDAAHRPLVDNHPVEVMSLKIGFAADSSACQVNGVWLVGTGDPRRGITEVVLIAPGRPDGNTYCVYKDLATARADPYWRSEEGYAWLKTRMSLADQQRFAVVTDRQDPVKNINPANRAYFTAGKMHFEKIQGNLYHHGYQRFVDTLLADARHQSTSTAEMDFWSGLSFTVDKILLLGDLVSVLPSLNLLSRLGRLTSLGRKVVGSPRVVPPVKGFNTPQLQMPLKPQVPPPVQKPPGVTGQNHVQVQDPPSLKKSQPFVQVTHRPDGIALFAGSTPPTVGGVAGLQERLRTLSLKEGAGLNVREHQELLRLKQEVPAMIATLKDQHFVAITSNRDLWWSFMHGIPELVGVGDEGLTRYVAYLLSQRGGSESVVGKILSSLANGVAQSPLPYRQLHQRALTMIDELVPRAPGVSGSGHASLPVQGNPKTEPRKNKSLPVQGSGPSSPIKPPGTPIKGTKHKSSGTPSDVSPNKLPKSVPPSPSKQDVTPYLHQINSNRQEWWPYLEGIADLRAVSDVGRTQYVSYLLSQRKPHEVTAILRSLMTVGVDKASPPFRQLHQRAMTMIDEIVPPVPGTSLQSPSKGVQGSSPSKKSSGGLTLEGQLPPPSNHPFVEVPRSEWPEILYHYTSEKNYAALMKDKFDFLNPSDVNPVGIVGNGAAPRIVYVTPVAPEVGRKQIAHLAFGDSQFQFDRSGKAARNVALQTRNLPPGTRIARFTEDGHTFVWTIGVRGDGSIPLRVGNEANWVWKKPVNGEEIVPLL